MINWIELNEYSLPRNNRNYIVYDKDMGIIEAYYHKYSPPDKRFWIQFGSVKKYLKNITHYAEVNYPWENKNGN